MKRLVFALLLCVVWTIWKALAISIWPYISSWRYLLKNIELAPLIYIALNYVWVVWALKILREKYRREVSWKNLLLGLLLALPIAIPIYFFKGEPDPLVILLTSVTFSVFGGVVEEVIYRGLLLDALMDKLDLKKAAVIQSIVFGLSHPWSWEPVVAAFLLGLLMTVLRLKIGMGCNIAFHWLINTVTHT